MWVGVDDTDSPRGGCTTHVLTDLVALARDRGLDLIGEPRLVRLNPNIPWKTRGNAALSARFGHGRGRRRRIGEVEGRAVWSRANGHPPTRGERESFMDEAWTRVLRLARSGDPGTDPALVVAPRQPAAELYRRAVREVVPVSAARTALQQAGAVWRTLGGDAGLVGAAAAIAWPGRRVTWEAIAYRPSDALSATRSVDAASVRAAQRSIPGLFLCHDPRTRRLLVAPHTACPILYGLRATSPSAALAGRRRIVSETVDRWLLFRTNQGTGDHLVRRPADSIAAYESGVVDGIVVGPPEVVRGGHVRFPVADRTHSVIECLAFEPTKTLPRVARTLEPGDRVRVWGGRAAGPGLRLEGLTIVRERPRLSPPRPPRCSACGLRSRSLGAHRGYRCPGCRARFPPEAAERSPRPTLYPPGTYHPTPSARRHLHPRGPEP